MVKKEKTDLAERFRNFIENEGLFQRDNSLLLAVSGGVDSVVLAELCYKCGYSFSIAHCNFKLRGNESDDDAQFVKGLAAKYGCEYFQKDFNTTEFAEQHKVSIQEAARDLRYKWFGKLVNKNNQPFNYILTAHHADDNIETVAMNFFRGTGISGLKGIVPKQANLVRPLLFARKEDLTAFAVSNDLAFREDSSNQSNKYTRNYFRNEILPSIEKVFPAVKANLIHNAERARDINHIYQNGLALEIKKLVTISGEEIHIPVLKLHNHVAARTLIYEIIKDLGFTAAQSDEVLKLMRSGSGKYISSSTHRILHNRKWLIISKLSNSDMSHILIDESQTVIDFPGGVLKLSRQQRSNIINDKEVAQIPLPLVSFPLILRKWKQGDYFYPLGMEKKKKLSRFFIDQKLSLAEKERVWVIESNKKIIWVIGHRLDNRFKVNPASEVLLKLDWIPAK